MNKKNHFQFCPRRNGHYLYLPQDISHRNLATAAEKCAASMGASYEGMAEEVLPLIKAAAKCPTLCEIVGVYTTDDGRGATMRLVRTVLGQWIYWHNIGHETEEMGFRLYFSDDETAAYCVRHMPANSINWLS